MWVIQCAAYIIYPHCPCPCSGPCSVKEDGSGTVTNPYSWNAGAS